MLWLNYINCIGLGLNIQFQILRKSFTGSQFVSLTQTDEQTERHQY